MRIKVESTPPLTTFKAWFVVSAASNVQDLKESLCSDVPALREHEVAADQIALVLDGFELLDSSPIDVVRDGDLVNVKQRAPSSNAAHKKRKAESPEALPPPKRPKSVKPTKHNVPQAKPAARKAPSTSSSSSSDSSSDSDDSSDDSTSSSDDSDSDSDSSSDDSSDSSSDSPPSVETSKARPAPPAKTAPAKAPASAAAATKPKPAESFTPPGHGKTATKNRNLRRRLKKHHERLAAEQASNGVFGVNNVPLGSRSTAIEQDIEASFDNAGHDDALPAPPQVRAPPPTIMMASLSNKNKRKGFKQAMASVLPKKIVFAAPNADEPEPAPLPFQAASSSEVTAAAPNIFPRLIPPSEKQQNGQIPANMIITSIDVEEGLYPERKNKGKGKKKAEARGQPVRSETQEVERVVLDYGDADDGEMENGTGNDDMIPTQRTVAPESELGKDADATEHSDLSPQTWALVEKKWETLPKIQDAKSTVTGSLVGWKALALNPATFTPEILLNIGRVEKNDPDLNLVVQPLLRPGATQSQVSFGGRLDVYEDEGGGEEEEAVVPEEETYEWNEVFSGDWRVLTGLEL